MTAHVRGFRYDGRSWFVIVVPDREHDLDRHSQQPAADLPADIRAALAAWLEEGSDG